MGERAHESYIRQAHLARPIGGEGDPDMSPNQLSMETEVLALANTQTL
jgi:hypothetical protein